MSVADAVGAVADGVARVVTRHNRLVILVMLVLTAGAVLGVTQEQAAANNDVDEGVIDGTDVAEAQSYLEANYFEDRTETTTVAVYVQGDEEPALSTAGLTAAVEYQQQITNEPAVREALAGAPGTAIRTAAAAVAERLTGEADPDLETQRAVISEASPETVAGAVEAAFEDGQLSGELLPTSYEPGTADATGFRLLVTVEGTPEPAVADALTGGADDVDERTPVTVFTAEGLTDELNGQVLPELAWLVVPLVLFVLAVVLGFAYRDLTDVLVSFTGVIVTLLWAFGLMGWLGLLNQQTGLVVPILAIALSIDFSFHVFMRYRERRAPGDGVRAALRRSTAAVFVAFLLVTLTAVISFLPNLTNPVGLIRDLTVAFVLAVVSALIVFTTLVPALKVSADGLWERFGFDRTATALGKGSYLSAVLGGSVAAARRAGLVVIAVALVVSAAGGVAFADIDRQQFQESDLLSDPGWQSELPGPMAYELHETETAQRLSFTDGFRPAGSDPDNTFEFTQILLRDSVATPETMRALATAEEAAATADPTVVVNRGGTVDVRSPLTAMRALAAENPDSGFAETFAAAAGAETTDPAELRTLVPQQNVPRLLDAFFAAAPEQADRLIERDGDEYPSLRVLVPVQGGFGDDRAASMYDIEAAIADAGGPDLSVTAVGSGTLNDAFLDEIVDGIVTTMLLALAGVFAALAVVYRGTYGSATLGAVTAVPIVLVLALVFLGMYALGEPLTANTALIVSIAIGLGIDYNIHVSDRFATELERGTEVVPALREATTGTGGALLGSAVTSTGAFSLLVIAPLATFQSIGTILALTLAVSFLLSVFVLPSLLYQWARIVRPTAERSLAEASESPTD